MLGEQISKIKYIPTAEKGRLGGSSCYQDNQENLAKDLAKQTYVQTESTWTLPFFCTLLQLFFWGGFFASVCLCNWCYN